MATAFPEFGVLLKRFRVAADMSQEELAARARLSSRAVSDLERGAHRAPRLDTIQLLADALGLSVADRDRLAQSVQRRRGPRGSPFVASAARFPALARPSTLLIGRDREVERVRNLLRDSAPRLLTLTGPGGVGKTRIALAATAHLVADFPDGVHLVNLAPLRDPDMVVSAIAAALGRSDMAGASPLGVLVEYLRPKTLLLVLDNFEHLTEAATAVARLLSECPRLKVLVTSRTILQLGGEQELRVLPFRVPPSDVLSLDGLARMEAVQLFVARARAAQIDFALTTENAIDVVEICRHVDGLPLAIELAAGWIRLLPPRVLRSRLERRLPLLTGGPRDAPIHQQNLRDTIAWSYLLLDPSEQQLFRRLSVFAGDIGLKAVEAISAAVVRSLAVHSDLGDVDILDRLASLVRHSLVQREEPDATEPRFRMLETIREYAHEVLCESGEADDVQRCHAVYFVELAEAAAAQLRWPEQSAWLERLDREHENLLAAIQWSLERGESDLSQRLGIALWRFWLLQGRGHEGERWLEEIATRTCAESSVLRARLLDRAAALMMRRGKLARATELGESALKVARLAGDRRILAQINGTLGWLAFLDARYSTATAFLNEALALHQDVGNDQGVAIIVGNLGAVALRQGNLAEASSHVEVSLRLKRAAADPIGIAYALRVRGEVAYLQGDDPAARKSLEESLATFRRVGDRRHVADVLLQLGDVARVRGSFAEALEHFTEGLAIDRALGDSWSASWHLDGLGQTASDQGDFEVAQRRLEEGLASRREIGDRRGIGVSHGRLGMLARRRGEHFTARTLLEAYLRTGRELSEKRIIAAALGELARVARATGDGERASQLADECLGAFRALADRASVALPLEVLAGLAADREQHQRAARLFGVVEALRDDVGRPRPPVDLENHERDVARVRAALGPQVFPVLYGSGREAYRDERDWFEV